MLQHDHESMILRAIVSTGSRLRTTGGRNDPARFAHARREEQPPSKCNKTRTRASDFECMVRKLLYGRTLVEEKIETVLSTPSWDMLGELDGE